MDANNTFANQALIQGYNYILETLFYQQPLSIHSLNIPFQRWDKQEIYFGESDEQYKMNEYYYALLYAYLFWRESSLYGQTLYDISIKFSYDSMKKCFGCKFIDIDKFLSFFGIYIPQSSNGQIPVSNQIGYGIEHIGIEQEFIVEPDLINYPTAPTTNNNNLQAILNSQGCVYSIPNVNISQCQ